MATDTATVGGTSGGRRHVRTNIPARMDRLPWTRWHWNMILALGITWILDGLEVTILGSISGQLQDKGALGLTAAQIADVNTAYLVGAVLGALVFGWLTDRLGRKKLFLITLGWYTVFTVCTAFSWNLISFMAFRFLVGNGIGGEYAAINSAIDELIPARRRGQVDLGINSSWWGGTMIASAFAAGVLSLFPANLGWRLAFVPGIVISLLVLWIRKTVPESPRWLMTHGKVPHAEQIVQDIEAKVHEHHGQELPPPEGTHVTVDTEHRVTLMDVAKTMIRVYPGRTFVSYSLMITQAFLYNAVFFTYVLILTNFFHVGAHVAPLFLIPIAFGNLVGPWVLGPLFDSVGRKPMIAGTYIVSGVLLIATAFLFRGGYLNSVAITLAWVVIFFFASAGASSAYLTVSEVFPMELRAMAIALVYAVGTFIGGPPSVFIFGNLIGTGDPDKVVIGYVLGAFLMILGGLSEIVFGVSAQRRSLEDIANPLSSVEVQPSASMESRPAPT